MSEARTPMVELEDLASVEAHLERTGSLARTVIQGLDLRGHTDVLTSVDVAGAVLLGCLVEPEAMSRLSLEQVLFFPPFRDLPFQAFRSTLYSAEELFAGYRPGDAASFEATPDRVVYHWYRDSVHADDVVDLLAQRIHDHAVDDALRQLIASIDDRPVVAIMGGHGMGRDEAAYRDVAVLARALTRGGRFCASGGGPGAMEATNLGAWFASRPDADLDDAISVLAAAPGHLPETAWLDAAFEVRARWPLPPGSVGSLGVPTWHYGHEPPNVFATHIAKYFANSIREDGLLAIALGGVVFAPGSAGTIQEVFQDAAQNHYRSFGVVSPMVFLGVDYWTTTKPVYPLLRSLASGHDYGEFVAIGDTVDDVLAHLGIPPG